MIIDNYQKSFRAKNLAWNSICPLWDDLLLENNNDTPYYKSVSYRAKKLWNKANPIICIALLVKKYLIFLNFQIFSSNPKRRTGQSIRFCSKQQLTIQKSPHKCPHNSRRTNRFTSELLQQQRTRRTVFFVWSKQR